MRVDTTDASSVSGFYLVGLDVFDETRAESKILQTFDLVSGLLHFGRRRGQPVWLFENLVAPDLCAVWVEEAWDEVIHAAAGH